MQSVERQLFLDLSNSTAGVQALWTCSRAVHDGVATVQRHGVLQHLTAHLGRLVTRVNQPPVRLHQHGGPQVLLLVPPVRRAGCGAACAKNALVQTVQLGTVLDALKVLAPVGGRCVTLQVGLDGLVLLVEVGQVGHQVPHNVHVGQRVDLGVFGGVCIYAAETSQGVLAANVHGARAADTFTARATECQRSVLLVLDLEKRVQNHGPAGIQVNVVSLHFGLHLRGVGVPSVDLEFLNPGLGRGGQRSEGRQARNQARKSKHEEE